jgi:hypothetical protein
MTDQLPPRPTSHAVAAALVRAAAGEPLLADRRSTCDQLELQRIDLVSGWQLAIWWRGGQLGPLHQAIDPDGLEWVHGCARWPDWPAGPESVVLDPIEHLLTSEQRQQLERRLRDARCWPAPPAPVGSVWPVVQIDCE